MVGNQLLGIAIMSVSMLVLLGCFIPRRVIDAYRYVGRHRGVYMLPSSSLYLGRTEVSLPRVTWEQALPQRFVYFPDSVSIRVRRTVDPYVDGYLKMDRE